MLHRASSHAGLTKHCGSSVPAYINAHLSKQNHNRCKLAWTRQCRSENASECDASWKGGVYTEHMRVRDYELDQFGVVNNAVYASYLQHARHEALACIGIDCDASARANMPLALSELNISFRDPLRSRDKFRVQVWVEKMSAARVTVGHDVQRQTQEGDFVTVAEATGVVVWLDSQYRPIRIPKDAREALQKLYDARSSQAN